MDSKKPNPELTPEQIKVLEQINVEGFACAGKGDDGRGRLRRVYAATLFALERRGYVKVYTHQDGNIAARRKWS